MRGVIRNEFWAVVVVSRVDPVDVAKLNWLLNKDAVGKADGSEVEVTPKVGKVDTVVVDKQFTVKLVGDDPAF